MKVFSTLKKKDPQYCAVRHKVINRSKSLYFDLPTRRKIRMILTFKINFECQILAHSVFLKDTIIY